MMNPSPDFADWMVEEMEDLADFLLEEFNGTKVLGWYRPDELIVKITPHRVVAIFWKENESRADYVVFGGGLADERLAVLDH